MVVIIERNRIVHDLIDDDVAHANGGVGGAGRLGGQPVELVAAIREAARRDPVLLAGKAHGIQDAGLGRVLEVDRLTDRAQPEVHVGLAVESETARRQDCAGRNHELVGGRIIREDAAGDVGRLRTVVVQLDVVVVRRIGVGEEFIDDHVAQRVGRDWVQATGRAADGIARGPSKRVVLAVGRPGQDQRMTGAISRNRPRGLVGVIGFQQQGAGLVEQLDAAAAAGQGIGVRAEDTCHAISALEGGGGPGDHNEATARNGCSGWERETDIARQLVAAEVLGFSTRVKQLDKLKGAVGRMVHDLRDDEAGGPSGLAESLECGRRAGADGGHGREIAERPGGRLVGVIA